jgi:hypothetical protein
VCPPARNRVGSASKKILQGHEDYRINREVYTGYTELSPRLDYTGGTRDTDWGGGKDIDRCYCISRVVSRANLPVDTDDDSLPIQ